ncbi:MAG: tyrosine-type recombinase/integrase [Gammaproteobacteria bacterium]
MLTTYFKRQTTLASYYAGPAGPYLDDFTDWLAQRGYQHECIRGRVRGAVQLGVWAQTTGCSLQPLSLATLNDFRGYLSSRGRLLYSGGQHSIRWLGAQRFVEFLQVEQLVTPLSASAPAVQPELLQAFKQWMEVHRGVRTSTLTTYWPHLVDLLTSHGERAEHFDAAQLGTFILGYAERSGRSAVRTRVKATRMFLRFLIATERCQPGLEAAVPTIAEWRLSTLPRYLPPEDVKHVIAGCDDSTAIGIRDKAIILLLARLALRASEVAGLQGDDIDWSQGTFSVVGKNRREARLPLPQEVGDALLRYLDMARPPVDSTRVFITATAPWRPITRYVVKSAAAQAIRRAGVEAPSFGAHVLRHSAATAMLREGTSLQVIGEVLRHRRIDTTAHYAKVDVGLLQQVTRPWPGAPSC